MEIINVNLARSIWLFDIGELNPRGKAIGSELIEWLKTKYSFSKFPANVNDLDDTKALHYGGGRFNLKDGTQIAVELKFYNDGVVADTRSSTEESDLFLLDALLSATQEFGLPYTPEIVSKKMYANEMIVKTTRVIQPISPKIQKFIKQLAKATGDAAPIELAGLGFWSETNPSHSAFKFERKYGAAFSANRYYTRAPLSTMKHLAILGDLEEAFS